MESTTDLELHRSDCVQPLPLYQRYVPLTANDPDGYAELAPCGPLLPYIRCFWVYSAARPALVIPDTCMDIIAAVDGKTMRLFFCGINDFSYPSAHAGQPGKVLYGIRFHFWSVARFAAQPLCQVRNSTDKMDDYFPGWRQALEPLFAHASETSPWPAVQRFLLAQLRQDPVPPVLLDMAGEIIRTRGTMDVQTLARRFGVHPRWVQRHFLSCFGVSCKRLSMLIRYQLIWQDCLSSRDFDLQKTIDAYGFYDQAHLLNFFKKYHGGSLSHFSNPSCSSSGTMALR